MGWVTQAFFGYIFETVISLCETEVWLLSFLLVTQAILCRFICESEISESKIILFRRIFWRICDQITKDDAFWGVNIS